MKLTFLSCPSLLLYTQFVLSLLRSVEEDFYKVLKFTILFPSPSSDAFQLKKIIVVRDRLHVSEYRRHKTDDRQLTDDGQLTADTRQTTDNLR